MSTRGTRTVVLTVVSALAVTLLVVATGSAARKHDPGRWERTIDRTATALAGPSKPTVRDSDFHLGFSRRWAVQADTTATGSANCDGCTADADVLEVLYVYRPRTAELNNVAAAWSEGCEDCRSSALSVQVVLVWSGVDVTVNNRALALNAACTLCAARSAAYQLVVLTQNRERLSRDEIKDLRAWVKEQRQALRQGGAALARGSARSQAASPDADTSELEALVTDAVGGRTLIADVDLGGD